MDDDKKTARISRLIRQAYAAAKAGNPDMARSFMKSAINSGYTPRPSSEREFEKILEQGTAADPDKPPAIGIVRARRRYPIDPDSIGNC